MILSDIALVLSSTFVSATPLIFTALGATFTERSGVTNIGVEGIMLSGAFSSVWASYAFHSPWIGVLVAIIIGILVSLIHGFLSITFKADQIISGTAINMLVLSVTAYMIIQIWKSPGQSPPVDKMNALEIPVLDKIPFIKDIINDWTIFVYMAIALVIIGNYVLFKTPFGLRLRAVGENPGAADTLGINVYKMRYIGVMISGALAGLGGSAISIGLIGIYRDNMTSGKGFIAIAAMIFGKWTPYGAFGACLLFGCADSMQILAQTYGWNAIPSEFWLSIPYLLTIIALVGFVGKSRAPEASGIPYEKGKR